MKLLIIQPYLNLKGGVERVILEVAKHYDATIYTTEYDKAATFEGFKDIDIKIVGKDVPLADRLPYRASQGLRYGYNFYHMKITEDYDVANPHISPSEWIRHKNERVLWYCHTPPREVYDLYAVRMMQRSYKEKMLYAAMTGAYKVIAKNIVKNIEEVAANSQITRQRIKKYYSKESTVINPGVDYEKFKDNGDGRYFLYPSRFVVNKRQEYVINAFKKYVKETKSKHSLVLAGTLSKDPEHIKYMRRLKSLAGSSNIKFIPNPGDKKLTELYSNSTAVLFAAINEDFGIVPLEGMASSKPVISVNEGGPTETIINGKTGFLVNSYSEMAERIKQIAENPSIAKKMGKAGRSRIIKHYSWQSFFESFDKLAQTVAKDKKGK